MYMCVYVYILLTLTLIRYNIKHSSYCLVNQIHPATKLVAAVVNQNPFQLIMVESFRSNWTQLFVCIFLFIATYQEITVEKIRLLN